jgi:hypothetical protein
VTHTFTYSIINQDTRELVKKDVIRVERQPSETDAYFLLTGNYKVLTSNGESMCQGPVWILWDTAGFPYPITPEEFDKLYVRKDTP